MACYRREMVLKKDCNAIFAIECESTECPFCLYGELGDAQIPLRLCVKHLDITMFILDKANIPCEADRFD